MKHPTWYWMYLVKKKTFFCFDFIAEVSVLTMDERRPGAVTVSDRR